MDNLPGYVKSIEDPKARAMLLGGLSSGASKRLTICEQMRFMYDTVYQMEDGEIKNDLVEKLIDAFAMAKKMNSRLAHYHRKYEDKTGHEGSNLIMIGWPRLRRKMRDKR